MPVNDQNNGKKFLVFKKFKKWEVMSFKFQNMYFTLLHKNFVEDVVRKDNWIIEKIPACLIAESRSWKVVSEHGNLQH